MKKKQTHIAVVSFKLTEKQIEIAKELEKSHEEYCRAVFGKKVK
jgi:hypothetical protein